MNEALTQLAPMKAVNVPIKGWIRAIRETLGMTGEQLARKLRTNKQRISRIEQDEIQGKLTLNTLRNVADALDCTLVYGLVPKHGLDQTIRQRAILLAQKRINRSRQMMGLGGQAVDEQDESYMVSDIMDEMPKALWEDL